MEPWFCETEPYLPQLLSALHYTMAIGVGPMAVDPRLGPPRNVSFALPALDFIKLLDASVDGVHNVGQHTCYATVTGLTDAGNRGDVGYAPGGVTVLAERIAALERYLTVAVGLSISDVLTSGSVIGSQLSGTLQQTLAIDNQVKQLQATVATQGTQIQQQLDVAQSSTGLLITTTQSRVEDENGKNQGQDQRLCSANNIRRCSTTTTTNGKLIAAAP